MEMAELTDDELRAEYQRLLNMLDRTPPEKLGMVLVVDPRDTELTRLRAELDRVTNGTALGEALAYIERLREELRRTQDEGRAKDATIARLEADARRWQFMYANDMTAEYSDHIMLVLNAGEKPHGSLFRSVVDAALSAPTGKGEAK
jgi:hypothetical protein